MKPTAPTVLREVYEGTFHAHQCKRFGTEDHALATRILKILIVAGLVEYVGDELTLTQDGLDQIQEAQW